MNYEQKEMKNQPQITLRQLADRESLRYVHRL